MTMPQMPGRRTRLAVVAAAIASALAGCGGSADQPREVQTSALATADGRRICKEIFTPALARSVANAAGRSCEKEVRQRLFSPDAEFAVSSDIRISGGRGSATIREQNGNLSQLVLLQDGGRWRIARVQPQRA
jgi:hypothetical protein